MDHLGTGKPWDLSRKTKACSFCRRSLGGQPRQLHYRVEMLRGIMGFIGRSNEDYILFSDCNSVLNIDVDELMDFHTDNNADISIVYKHGVQPQLDNTMTLRLGDDGRVEQIAVSPNALGEVDYSLI